MVQFTPAKLRIAASLVSAMGKMPILVPQSTNGSISLYLTLCHWNLAVCVLGSAKGLSEKAIDSLLCSAGFMKGVFETMKKV